MEVHIGKRVAEIDLISKEGNKVQLNIDGKVFEVDIVMTENGVCSLLHNGKSFNAQLIRSDKGKKYKVNTHFSSFDVEIIDNQAKFLRMRKKDDGGQDDKIISPMPGKVVKVLVNEGDEVASGDNVIVIEAMKMQSNYKVNSDCTIKEILVKEGDTVSGDQVLIKLDLKK